MALEIVEYNAKRGHTRHFRVSIAECSSLAGVGEAGNGLGSDVGNVKRL